MPNFQKARAWSHASMRAACLLSGVAALALCSPVAAAKANTNAGQGNFYFFGDSNIGQGNFSAIVGSRYDDFYPNSSNNGFERDSNGLIWAEMLGRPVFAADDVSALCAWARDKPAPSWANAGIPWTSSSSSHTVHTRFIGLSPGQDIDPASLHQDDPAGEWTAGRPIVGPPQPDCESRLTTGPAT